MLINIVFPGNLMGGGGGVKISFLTQDNSNKNLSIEALNIDYLYVSFSRLKTTIQLTEICPVIDTGTTHKCYHS